ESIGTLPEARALQGCEDWHFWLQAVLRGVVIERVPDVLCLYRLHAGSSGSSSLAIARRESALMRSARDLFARHGETGERSRSFLAAGMASVASRWLLLGEPAAYRELMALARAEAPEAFREARLGEIRNALPAARLPSAADESALLHLRLGDALASLGSPVLAATLFLRCRTFSRLRSVAARFGEGETLDRMLLTLARVVDAALTERERGSPASFATHVATALGLVERSAGRLEEARARFEEALLLDANNTWAALELLALDLRGGRLLAARRRWSALGRGGSRRALRAGALWILQRHPRLRELARSLAAKIR
ncbi:MAG: hypothetical protein JNK60_00785, partial [Acidobacteria bacterium]|nr:hypothetical protein [Acidobacteriota bacterium]